MKHEISDDRKRLTIKVTPEEQKELREMEDIQSDRAMVGFLEPLTCNSELEWINPADTGDLTGAPMLGICGEEYPHENLPHYRYGEIQSSGGPARFRPILERWAFLDYQVRSVLEDLRDRGVCVFVS